MSVINKLLSKHSDSMNGSKVTDFHVNFNGL